VGGVNTALTGLMFLALSSVIAPTLSYTVAFVSGIAFSVIVTPRLVFRARVSIARRTQYVAWYLTVYAVGLGLVYLLHDRLLVGTVVVAAVTFAVTAGLSFVGARYLFDRPGVEVALPDGSTAVPK
jgi:putative flippase GtrA